MDENQARAMYGHGVVATSLRCRQCGYELRGLNAARLCPECGLSIWASVLHAADPEGSRLPQIRKPKAVGGALLWLAFAFFTASIFWVIRPGLAWLDRIDPTAVDRFSRWTPPQPKLIASLLVLSVLWSLWRLKPPRGVTEPSIVRRDLRLLFIGLFFSGLAMLELTFASSLKTRLTDTWSSVFQLAISLALVFFFIIALIGLQGVIRLIGQRSRQYRTARESRQNVHALIAVVGCMALGLLLRHIPRNAWPSDGFWTSLSQVIVLISYVMFVVGLGYLLVNTVWIRRALRQQQPTIGQLLMPPMEDDVRLPDIDMEADRAEGAIRHCGEGEVHDGGSRSSSTSS